LNQQLGYVQGQNLAADTNATGQNLAVDTKDTDIKDTEQNLAADTKVTEPVAFVSAARFFPDKLFQ
jgi:hypothetical protein